MPNWKIGADVSVYQGDINWDQLKRVGRTSFVFIKTSEGYGFTDPKWDRNRREATRVGMDWGGYHFAHPNGGTDWPKDAQDEARWFVSQGGASGPLPGVLDLESTQLNRDETLEWAEIFCETVNKLAGRTMTILYTGYYFLGGGIAEDERLRHCPWWLAWYTHGYDVNPDPFTMTLPATNRGRSWDIWQYTSSGRDTGVDGNLDMNVMSPELFHKLKFESWADPKQAPTPADPPEEEDEDTVKMAIAHCDTRTSARLRHLLGDSEGFPDVAMVCYSDGTMKQITGDEIGKYKFYGAVEFLNEDGTVRFFNGDEGDANWWFQFSLRDRDFAAKNPREEGVVLDVEPGDIPAPSLSDADKDDIAQRVLAALRTELND